MQPQEIERFGAAAAAAENALDWSALGASYCEGDAREFFDADRIAETRDTALEFAAELAELHAKTEAKAEPRSPRRSLFVGAAVAELWIVLFERIVLGRRVAWVNLASKECTALDAALAAAEAAAGVELPRVRTIPWTRAEIGPCDHLWLCSVLTDPDRFPALHDSLYERIGSPEAIGGGHPSREREAARRLVVRAFECLVGDAIVTTTEEELALLHPIARDFGARLDVPADGRTSALVGDVVRHCRWRATGAPAAPTQPTRGASGRASGRAPRGIPGRMSRRGRRR